MTHDPLSVLRDGDVPVRPDPEFAARLRRRLESALSLPHGTEGVTMSGTASALEDLTTDHTLPRPAVLPYLTVSDARAALRWYADVLGASVVSEPVVMADGRIGHAELALAGGTLYLADEYPEIGLRAPAPGAVSVSLMLPVDDTDAALRRARDHGGRVEREPYEDHGSRSASIVDPFGHRWMLTGPLTGATTTIKHGDVGYVAVWTPDATRAAAFYGHVLGWTYDPATHQITNTTAPIGIFEAPERHTLFCCYAVTDLDGTRESIQAGGGTVGTVREFDFGTVLDATDPQGAPFAVFVPAPTTPRPELNGAGPGELSYITYEVADSAAFRAFFSRVLFWTYQPGRIEDGWQVDGTHPMAGISGGHPQAVTVPMWTVADIDAAVTRVREAGGSVLQEPSRQPYGRMAECTDDQGGRFYLGEF
ncbi:VOC family protein [Mycobacterium sp. ACS4331]|uniref:VOC family protein n=1 Tax=Mycobacterium sp. ACS4331 TaxID=1834121 RepID=UPI00080174CF|nr:VOC family protein [Mycobacterium sp. ACS4331]OBF26829.1 glyoxalase [Mycobacterium sp. ACS4331]